MSIVSSALSSRSSSSSWHLSPAIHDRILSLMDSIAAIAFGLGLRFVVDLVSHHDFKLTGTLVGLWEGVVMLHFLQKMPKSTDPYLAYGVRLFVDLIVTESFARLLLVLIWTGLGMVLADITPAIWVDVGLNRIWRRFRRDIYLMQSKIPRVALFPRARTVRFSPSRAPSIITSAPSVSPSNPNPSSPGVPTTRVIPPTPSPSKPLRKRPVPGFFPDGISETDTDLTSVRPSRYYSEASTSAPGTSYHRYSTVPTRHRAGGTETDFTSSSITSPSNLDDANLSSDSESDSTIDPSAFNPSEIPDIEERSEQVAEEEETPMISLVDKGKKPERNPDGLDLTPKARPPMILPPTPSDSARAFDFHKDEYEEPPLTAKMPIIPDTFDAGGGFSDWENVTKEEAVGGDIPPVPPPKDHLPTAYRSPPSPVAHIVPPPVVIPPAIVSTPTADVPTGNLLDADDYEMFNSNEVPALVQSPAHFDSAPLDDEKAQVAQEQEQAQDQEQEGEHQTAVAPPTRDPLRDLLSHDRPPSYSEPYNNPINPFMTNGYTNEKEAIPEEPSPTSTDADNANKGEGAVEQETEAGGIANDAALDINNSTADANAMTPRALNNALLDSTEGNIDEGTGANDVPAPTEGAHPSAYHIENLWQNGDNEAEHEQEAKHEQEQEAVTAAAQTGNDAGQTHDQQQEADQAHPPPPESATSEVSVFPGNVADRLHKVIVLRSQMMQMESIIAGLKAQKESAGEDGWSAEKEAELVKSERVLTKMNKKAERRYKEASENSSLSEAPEEVELGNLTQPKAEKSIEEALEMHLKPGHNSFSFSIMAGPAKKTKLHKQVITSTLDGYYVAYTNDSNNGRVFYVELTEAEYPEWLEKNRLSAIDQDDL